MKRKITIEESDDFISGGGRIDYLMDGMSTGFNQAVKIVMIGFIVFIVLLMIL